MITKSPCIATRPRPLQPINPCKHCALGAPPTLCLPEKLDEKQLPVISFQVPLRPWLRSLAVLRVPGSPWLQSYNLAVDGEPPIGFVHVAYPNSGATLKH